MRVECSIQNKGMDLVVVSEKEKIEKRRKEGNDVVERG